MTEQSASMTGGLNDSPKSETANEENHLFSVPFTPGSTDLSKALALFEAAFGTFDPSKRRLVLITDGDPLCRGCIPSKLDLEPFFKPLDNAFAPFDENVTGHEVLRHELSSRLYGHPAGYQGCEGGALLERPWDNRWSDSLEPLQVILFDEISDKTPTEE